MKIVRIGFVKIHLQKQHPDIVGTTDIRTLERPQLKILHRELRLKARDTSKKYLHALMRQRGIVGEARFSLQLLVTDVDDDGETTILRKLFPLDNQGQPNGNTIGSSKAPPSQASQASSSGTGSGQGQQPPTQTRRGNQGARKRNQTPGKSGSKSPGRRH